MTIENLKQDERITALENFKENLFDTLYPVGSVYITFSKDFDPNDVFTGRWTRNGTKGYALVGAIDPDEYRDPSNSILEIAGGSTQGEVEHTLTVEEMPSHNHRLQMRSAGSGDQEIEDWGAPSVIQTNMGYAYALATGGSQAHNNVQPSIGVYIWHRTA